MPVFLPDSKNSRKPLCANDLITAQVYSEAIRLSRRRNHYSTLKELAEYDSRHQPAGLPKAGRAREQHVLAESP